MIDLDFLIYLVTFIILVYFLIEDYFRKKKKIEFEKNIKKEIIHDLNSH
ncbi:MAG: hypothetical protein KC589_08910 [Nanoarchaeota archaeon]|nr:hypothetical protein [Nanoarchaeota archaeon]MCA9497040.1 hypothetical protein [Nanoarchaeota archaeon]